MNIDFLILDRSERSLHRFQILTGRTCFWIAKWTFIMAALSMAYFSVTIVLDVAENVVESVILGGVLAFLNFRQTRLTIEMIVSLEEDDRQFAECPDLKNARALSLERARKTVLIFIPIVFATMLMDRDPPVALGLFFLLLAAFLYFISCTPLPPQASKVRLWIEAGKAKLQALSS